MHSGEKATKHTDTSPRALERYYQRIRETPPSERFKRAGELSEQVLNATYAAVRRQMPDASKKEVDVAFVRRVYGDRLADRLRERLK